MSRYRFGKKNLVTRRRARTAATVGMVVFLATGGYLLALVLSPRIITSIKSKSTAGDIPLASATDRILIPKIGVDIEYRSGGPETLNDYSWHRYPERGNPVDGGNMILSAHRFSLAPTPSETRRKSPFYNIHRLSTGDDIYVYYHGMRYDYKVEERHSVSPLAVEIEDRSETAKLTLYSCTLAGERDGREVVIARPI